MNEGDDRSRERRWAVAAHMTAVAYEFFGSILGGAFLGYLIDRYFGIEPWGLIACILLGTTSGLYRMVTILSQLEKRKADD